MQNLIKQSEELVQKGLFLEALKVIDEVLEKSSDPIVLRIATNRESEIKKTVRNATHRMLIESNLSGDYLNCAVKVVFKHEHISALIRRLFTTLHKKNYSKNSRIDLNFTGNGANIVLKGENIDPIVCAFCRKFRSKLIDNIDKNDIVITNNCFMDTYE